MEFGCYKELLARSLALCDSVKLSIKSKNILGFALATRAHLETTALLACLNKKFSDFYSGKCTQEALETFLKKALLGVKDPNTIGIDSAVLPTPPHILTLLEKTDKILKELGISEKRFFLEKHSSLSEICHPNFHGTVLDAELILEEGRIIFRHYSESFAKTERMVRPIFKVSTSLFFNNYNHLFTQLSQNEEMPKIIR